MPPVPNSPHLSAWLSGWVQLFVGEDYLAQGHYDEDCEAFLRQRGRWRQARIDRCLPPIAGDATATGISVSAALARRSPREHSHDGEFLRGRAARSQQPTHTARRLLHATHHQSAAV